MRPRPMSRCGRNGGHVQRRGARDEHHVPAALTSEGASPADDGHVLEQATRGRGLGPHEPERRVVDEVHDVHPAGPQDPHDLVQEFGRGQMPGYGQPAERVADAEVDAVIG